MANPEHVEILRKDVEVWNQWRKDNSDVIPDLSGANFRGRNLSRVNLSHASLTEVNFTDAYLYGAKFYGAGLYGANLSRVNLSYANLAEANLSEADLSGANLIGVNFIGARLNEANFIGADLSGAYLGDAEIKNTGFSSRNSLNHLSASLDDKQIAGAIFEDERDDLSIKSKGGAGTKETTIDASATIKQKIKIAVDDPKKYPDLCFRANDLVVMVKALIEYYTHHDNEITPEERDIKKLLQKFGEKLDAFTIALESYPENKNIDELELKTLEFKHELEVIDKKALNEMLGKWNILAVSVAGTAVLGLMGVPVATAAGIAFTTNAVGAVVKDLLASK